MIKKKEEVNVGLSKKYGHNKHNKSKKELPVIE